MIRILSTISGVVLSSTYYFLKNKSSAEEIKDSDLELVQVQVITRHGARTPLLPSKGKVDDMFFGMDPYNWQCEDYKTTDGSLYLHPEGKNPILYDDYKKSQLHTYEKPKIFGNCVDAQLTLLGMQQTSDFGKLLRERYITDRKFLSPTYKSSDIWIRSSNTSRTILTARQVMRGLYPDDNRPPNAQVTINIAQSENLYPPYPNNCEKWGVLKKDVRKEQDQLLEKMKSILSKAENPFWWHRTSIASVANNLNTFVDHQFPLPKGLTEEDFNVILGLGGEQFVHTYPTEDIQRIAIGRLIGEVNAKINKAINPKPGETIEKFHLFSGHDNTLGPLLVTFGALDGKHPRMGAAVILEIFKHKKMKELYYLKLLYYDPVNKLRTLKIDQCTNSTCPLGEYLKLSDKKIPKDFVAECKI